MPMIKTTLTVACTGASFWPLFTILAIFSLKGKISSRDHDRTAQATALQSAVHWGHSITERSALETQHAKRRASQLSLALIACPAALPAALV